MAFEPSEGLYAGLSFVSTSDLTAASTNVDKFKELGLTKEKGFIVNSPMIKECPINIECKVRQIIHLGTHDMFIGEVVGVYADEEVIYSDGEIDYERINMVSYLMDNYFKNLLIKK